MPTPTASDSPLRFATWLNLFVPGGGLIVVGRARTGLVTGIAFALSANIALASRLLVPDDVPAWAQNLAIVIACLVYVAAQGLLLRSTRPTGADRTAADVRRAAIREIERLVDAGEYEVARRVIEAHRALAREDLHVAFRRAQVLTEINHADAPTAWRQLGALDRHGLYRAERLAGLDRLRDPTAARTEEP